MNGHVAHFVGYDYAWGPQYHARVSAHEHCHPSSAARSEQRKTPVCPDAVRTPRPKSVCRCQGRILTGTERVGSGTDRSSCRSGPTIAKKRVGLVMKLFIHGVPDTGYMWTPLVEALDLSQDRCAGALGRIMVNRHHTSSQAPKAIRKGTGTL